MHVLRPVARLLAAALLMALVFAPAAASAANFPLEITNIGPVGVNGMGANNRIFRAYPGLPYNIRVAVVGGAFPFSFSLGNAPSGMTVNSSTGEIVWPSPNGQATPTVTVVDSEGARVSATWNINVTTDGFRFVDAARGVNAPNNGCSSGCGTGSAQSPWRTFADVFLNDSVGDIVYFRAGTYRVGDVPSQFRQSIGGVWERVVINENRSSSSAGSVIWLGYPGETPVIDFACGNCAVGIGIRHNGENVYIDGFETRNSNVLAFQFEPTGALRGPTYRRLNMRDHGPGGDGTNAAFIMTTSFYPAAAYGMVIQDCAFTNVRASDPDDAVTVKIYSQNKPLIEDTTHQFAVKALELKADVRQFTVRRNRFFNLTNVGIGGNMHGCVGCAGGSDAQTTTGEIVYNYSNSSGGAMALNQDGQARAIYVTRNTLIGRVQLMNTDGNDGPFYFTNNVIVNSDNGTPAGSRITHISVSAPSRQVLSNNLTGSPSDNMVDSAGNLTAGYANYASTHGWQAAGGENRSPNTPPAAPSNVRITSGN